MIEWKPVKDYEGIYEVSNQGDVKRVLASKGAKANRILKPAIGKNGYHGVILSAENVKSMRYVHRLVAEAFLEQFDGQTQVNHKNMSKLDNGVENLEWVSPSENQYHSNAFRKAA